MGRWEVEELIAVGWIIGGSGFGWARRVEWSRVSGCESNLSLGFRALGKD